MVSLKVPPGSQPNSKLRLKGKGIRRVNNPMIRYIFNEYCNYSLYYIHLYTFMIYVCRGNQIVNLVVNIPTSLTEKQKSLLQEFDTDNQQKVSGEGATLEDQKGKNSENFSLKQAWSRLSEFLSKKQSSSSK
jgi:DnaJ-class molecular chaperone